MQNEISGKCEWENRRVLGIDMKRKKAFAKNPLINLSLQDFQNGKGKEKKWEISQLSILSGMWISTHTESKN